MALRDRGTRGGPLEPVIIADVEDGVQVPVIVAPGTDFSVSVADAVTPEKFLYEHLLLTSGPQSASGEDYDLNTNSSLATPSVFEYVVPAFTTIDFARATFFITDGAITPNKFGGVAALANGCLFEIIDTDGSSVLLDFFNGVPIKTNDQFAKIAGIDAVATFASGDDWLPIRFTVQKAGKKMRLTAGQRVRWTNRDNISTITRFQFVIQAISVT